MQLGCDGSDVLRLARALTHMSSNSPSGGMKDMVRSTSKRARRTHLWGTTRYERLKDEEESAALVKFDIFHFNALSLRCSATVRFEQQLVIQAQL